MFCISALFCSQASAKVVRVDNSGMEYRMERGNSIWSVCGHFCKKNSLAATRDIVRINGIKNARKIPIGKHIRIPREYLGFTIAVTEEPSASTAVSDNRAAIDATIQELQGALANAREQAADSRQSAESLARSLADEEQQLTASAVSYDRVLLGLKIVSAVLIIAIIAALVMAIRRFLENKRVVHLAIRFEIGRLEDKLDTYRFGTKLVSRKDLIAKVKEAITRCLIGVPTPVPEDQKAIHKLAEDNILVFE